MTVLVVDDEASIRRVVRRALERNGAEVLEAEGGETALTILQRRGDPVDLVITDLAMPGIGGLAVAEVLSVFRPELPVLAMSGNPRMPSPDRRLPLLLKPFTLPELLVAIRLVQSRSRHVCIEEHRRVAHLLHAAAGDAQARGTTLRSAAVDLVAMARLLQKESRP
jgi:two-component system cell cycle response regulator CpdR